MLSFEIAGTSSAQASLAIERPGSSSSPVQNRDPSIGLPSLGVSSARPVLASPARGLANPPRFQVRIAASAAPAGVAQLVEQRIRNAKVGSSTLFTGTKFQKATLAVAFCFSGAASTLPGPYYQSRTRTAGMSDKGCGLPFPFHTEAEHGTTLSKTCRSSTTPARPSSSAVALARFQTARRPHAPLPLHRSPDPSSGRMP